ncbi:MAG: hypothetical protein EBZ77_07325 [Chitinophagia bacterium]|nr:hypothetical protein [Chitinophagia bacterium]
MRPLVTIFVAISLLLQTLGQLVAVADYYAHKDYIARNLCENRARPAMRCEGKCCLKKRLAREAKQHAPGSKRQKTEQVVVLSMPNGTIELPIFTPVGNTPRFFTYNDMRTVAYNGNCFHPPTV